MTMRLADFIESNLERILGEWEAFAATLTPAASGMSSLCLRDHARQILQTASRDLREPQSPQAQQLKSQGESKPSPDASDTAAEEHGALRVGDGFELDQMVAEYRALRASVLRLWMEDEPEHAVHVQDMVRFNEAIDQALAESISVFNAEIERSRDLLVGVLGHDLRTPLQSIRLTTELLSRLNAGQQVSDAASKLARSGVRMQTLLDGVVDFTRLRFGQGITLHTDDVDLAAVGKEEVDQLRVAYPGRDLRLVTKNDCHGRWDRHRLQQVLANLVANAMKHGAPDGPVDVNVTGFEDNVVLEVTNRGNAIEAADIKRVFEPLERGTSSHSTEGTGLGLFITRELVTAHGGEISVRSDADATVFSVRLPRAEVVD